MSTLKELGFRKNWIYEVVISCFDGHTPHAAPFGVKTPDLKRLILEMYKGSHTLQHVLAHKAFAINVVDDPTVFYQALFDKKELDFGPAEGIKAPVLRDSPALIEARVMKAVDREHTCLIEADVVNIRFRNPVELTNRAKGLVLEGLILATRIPYLSETKPVELLRDYDRVIKKVAPGSKYEDLMQGLLDRCDK